jgi:hypothetical protein
MTLVNLWDWFNAYRRDAVRSGSAERQQLAEFYRQAQSNFETNPEQALALLDQGRALAERLGEPCWVLFYDFWRCAVYMNFLDDKITARDLAVRTAVEARKPVYNDCPVRSRVHSILIDAYLFTDPIGYAEKTREALDYLEREELLEIDVWRLVEHKRAHLALLCGQIEEAQQAALRHLARCENDQFRLANAYDLLSEIAYYGYGDLAAALKYAQANEVSARKSKQQRVLIESLCWQALFARKMGEEDKAKRLYRVATASAARLGRKFSYAYYDSLCEYHELGREPEHALRLRDQQLEQNIRGGNVHWECECRLKRCQLLARMGKPLDDELAQAREAAQKLLNPTHFLEKLDQVESGGALAVIS